jgi:hypothetical protein
MGRMQTGLETNVCNRIPTFRQESGDSGIGRGHRYPLAGLLCVSPKRQRELESWWGLEVRRPAEGEEPGPARRRCRDPGATSEMKAKRPAQKSKAAAVLKTKNQANTSRGVQGCDDLLPVEVFHAEAKTSDALSLARPSKSRAQAGGRHLNAQSVSAALPSIVSTRVDKNSLCGRG